METPPKAVYKCTTIVYSLKNTKATNVQFTRYVCYRFILGTKLS